MRLSKRQDLLASAVQGSTSKESFKIILNISELCKGLAGLVFEAALAKDLLKVWGVEKTYSEIQSMGYVGEEVRGIVETVIEITDAFTKEEHPNMNRAQRLELENQRIKMCTPEAKSIICAEVIVKSKKVGSKFRERYAEEMYERLVFCHGANKALQMRALRSLGELTAKQCQ